jgi:hypothetical protein
MMSLQLEVEVGEGAEGGLKNWLRVGWSKVGVGGGEGGEGGVGVGGGGGGEGVEVLVVVVLYVMRGVRVLRGGLGLERVGTLLLEGGRGWGVVVVWSSVNVGVLLRRRRGGCWRRFCQSWRWIR